MFWGKNLFQQIWELQTTSGWKTYEYINVASLWRILTMRRSIRSKSVIPRCAGTAGRCLSCDGTWYSWLDHKSKLDFRKGLLVPKKQTSFMRTFMNMLLCITLKLLMQIILQIAWNCQHTAAVAHVRLRGKIVCCRARQMQKMCRTRCMT